MSQFDWHGILSQFEAPGHPGVYILGCFARYVTLYSQQVRALNLIAGLLETGRIKAGSRIAVIGAGAAGLTASAAAAQKDVNVTLIEELEGPMELQVNNRQRYLHPHIYDWPHIPVNAEVAKLPVLNWTAEYAENVAEQLKDRWKKIQDDTKRIEAIYGARHVALAPVNAGTRLSWTKGETRAEEFDAIVVAVGFGLERSNPYQYECSYWSEDDIDGGFRRVNRQDRWLISGYGDGALTDLMRLCIHGFRHHEIVELFQTADGIKGVIEELEEIRNDPGSADPNQQSDCFENLATDTLAAVLKGRLRDRGPEVFLTGKDPRRYGPGASVLNRLIVLVLGRLGAYSYLPGPTRGVEVKPDGFHVLLAGPEPIRFDRVLLRHGPEPALKQFLGAVWSNAESLRQNWLKLPYEEDKTRLRLWSREFFGPEIEEPEPRTPASRRPAARKFGLQARHLFVQKELRKDGSYTVSFLIERLEILDGAIEGIRIHFTSSCGRVGGPAPDAAGRALGVTWEPDQLDFHRADPIDELRERTRRAWGILRFGGKLTKSDKPISFGFSIDVLNGDALTTWEFDQLYEHPTAPIGDELERYKEYVACTIWFPVDAMTIRLRLPERQEPLSLRVHCYPAPDQIDREDVVDRGILRLGPDPESRFSPFQKPWIRDLKREAAIPPIEEVSPRTWQVVLDEPPVGTSYTLDWPVAPSVSDDPGGLLIRQTERVRSKLIDYGRQIKGDPLKGAGQPVRALLGKLHKLLRQECGIDLFDLTLMTYDESERKLVVVDALAGGAPAPVNFWNFWLPFGLGLGGACFKQGSRAYSYDPPRGEVEFYLPVAGFGEHAALLAVPLDHPLLAESWTLERSRQCIGVVDIGTLNPASKLKGVSLNGDSIVQIGECCQAFANALYEALL